MTIMNSRWRDWKSNLKSDHFVSGYRAKSIENTSANDRVKLNQWATLVDYWLTDDAKVVFVTMLLCFINSYLLLELLIFIVVCNAENINTRSRE